MAGFELTPEEIKLFIEEASEQLQVMEGGLLALEDDPESMELVQEIFRAAHTVKGGAATAGFANVAELTHAMESLLDLVRQGKARMSPEIGDCLLQGVDVLRECLAAIERSGSADQVDTSAAIAVLQEGIRIASGEEAPAAAIPGKPRSAESAKGAGGETVGVVVRISPEALMPAVRAYQVLLAIEDVSPIVATRPERHVIETDAGEVREVFVFLSAGAPLDAVKSAALGVPDVIAVESLGGASRPAAAAATPQEPSAAPQESEEREKTPVEEPASRRTEAEAPGKGASDDGARGGRGGGGSQADLGKTIRVDVHLLDTLMNLVGELVIDRTRLVQLSSVEIERDELQQELSQLSGRLNRVTTELQERIMQARMMPVEMLFKRFPRMVRDLSRQLGKPIEFEMYGKETELDRSVIEQIGDPLMHLLRNAVDHGIEPAEERLRLGKSEVGRVSLTAYHQENHIYIEVSDDGRGIDTERVKRRAVEKGFMTEEEAERLTPEEAAELIFLPGLSTARKVSSVSGRGVGMDVVRKNIEKVNGSVSIRTEKGKGTTITIKLPLTLAIVQALLVEIAGHTLAIPLSNVTEAVQVSLSEIHRANGWEMIAVRDEMVPLLNPASIWGERWSVKRRLHGLPVVILRSGSLPVGLKVDRLIGEQEIVIKSMGSIIGDVPGISGASILGDGRVALIVDPASLSKAAKESARITVRTPSGGELYGVSVGGR